MKNGKNEEAGRTEENNVRTVMNEEIDRKIKDRATKNEGREKFKENQCRV